MSENFSEQDKIKNFLLNGTPVISLTGNEFAKKDGYTLTQQVTEYYGMLGNEAMSAVYGNIILDKQSVEDDFAHGVGRTKAVAFAAVPAVIEKGTVILPLAQHKKNDKRESAMIAAPIRIAENDYICVVVIRQYVSGNKKLYVHEVTIKDKFLVGGSNPTQMPATQGIVSKSPKNIGDISKVLQNILTANN
ncbi:MAG: hypothetical protein LBN95_04380 [Prevotellaceae bacterium]|jgi:hypothetical protein|nr:hypothetical protein [Prevotellaceae bacterium]